jgi:ribose/xylose/arabinose/galactoside ABC-type transport system permease subunit
MKTTVAQYAGLLIAMGVVLIYFGLFAKNFLTSTTLLTIANTIPDITVISVGMTLVLISRHRCSGC